MSFIICKRRAILNAHELCTLFRPVGHPRQAGHTEELEGSYARKTHLSTICEEIFILAQLARAPRPRSLSGISDTRAFRSAAFWGHPDMTSGRGPTLLIF